MTGVIIYTTDTAEMNKFCEATGATAVHNAVHAIELLKRGKVVCALSWLCTGWHAPKGTLIAFSSTFPAGPEMEHAKARVDTWRL